jgi:hypothetical protein
LYTDGKHFFFYFLIDWLIDWLIDTKSFHLRLENQDIGKQDKANTVKYRSRLLENRCQVLQTKKSKKLGATKNNFG